MAVSSREIILLHLVFKYFVCTKSLHFINNIKLQTSIDSNVSLIHIICSTMKMSVKYILTTWLACNRLIFSDTNQELSSSAAFRSANSLESLDFVTNSIQQARANSLSSAASSLKYFNGLNSQCNVSASQCDQFLASISLSSITSSKQHCFYHWFIHGIAKTNIAFFIIGSLF